MLALGGLVGQQHAAADLLGLLEALESGGQCLPVIVAEVRVAGAGGKNQSVIPDLPFIEHEPASGEIDLFDLGEEDRDVGRLPQNGSKRNRDVRGVQHGGGNLVEQWLKEMMIAPVEERDTHRPVGERAGGAQPAEAAAHDHHVRERSMHNS